MIFENCEDKNAIILKNSIQNTFFLKKRVKQKHKVELQVVKNEVKSRETNSLDSGLSFGTCMMYGFHMFSELSQKKDGAAAPLMSS